MAAADGSGAHALTGAGTAGSPAWSPDGTRIAFASATISDTELGSKIEVMNRDGSGRHTVVALKARRGLEALYRPAWTPDGTRLLYTRTRYAKDDYSYDIHSVAAGGGDDRLFMTDAEGGDFSHDGTRLVYGDVRDSDGHICGSDECYRNADLAIAAADGSGRHVLLRTRSDEADGRWAPGDALIAFSSARNLPVDDGAPELYTVAPDGSCLTWLTNGAQASTAPTWLAGSAVTAAACGGAGRAPLADAPPPPRGRWWVGARMGSALLSDHYRPTVSYEDCAAFAAKDCLPLFLLSQRRACGSHDALVHPRRVRGALVADPAGESPLGRIVTGRTLIRVQFQSPAGAKRRHELMTRIANALQKVGEKRTRVLAPPAAC